MIKYIKTITINTHIDCLNNSKCSVRDILLATKQGAFESVLGTFSDNRILSKVQKFFWSCTHVNSCQKYTLYINLHILLNILS